jgi:hypothetical protein
MCAYLGERAYVMYMYMMIWLDLSMRMKTENKSYCHVEVLSGMNSVNMYQVAQNLDEY